jgi:hypothetical protein
MSAIDTSAVNQDTEKYLKEIELLKNENNNYRIERSRHIIKIASLEEELSDLKRKVHLEDQLNDLNKVAPKQKPIHRAIKRPFSFLHVDIDSESDVEIKQIFSLPAKKRLNYTVSTKVCKKNN